MKIHSLYIDNYIGFKKQRLFFNQINFLIGPNGVGKSKILDAFKIINSFLNNKTGGYNYGEWVFDKNDKLQIRLQFDFILEDTERNEIIELLFQSDDMRNKISDSSFATRIRYRIDLDSYGIKMVLIRLSNIEKDWITIISKLTEDEEILNIGHLEIINLCKKLNELNNLKHNQIFIDQTNRNMNLILKNNNNYDECENYLINLLRLYFKRINWVDPYYRVEEEDIDNFLFNIRTDEDDEITEKISDNNIISKLRDVAVDDSWEYVRLSRYIKRIIPMIEKNSSPIENNEITLKYHEKGLTRPLDYNNMSLGIKQVSKLVTSINMMNNSSLILLEEPESNLHASSQRKLLNLIKGNQNMQFIITTHSTIFTGCDDVCSTFLFNKKDGMIKVNKINKNNFSDIKRLLGHRNSDLFYDECIIFVEGESEYTFYPMLMDHLNYDLKDLGIKFINVKGKDGFLKIEKILEYLKNTDTISYIIADGNKKLSTKISDWEKNGLINSGSSTIWNKEFEDIFDYSLIIKAFNSWLKNMELEVEINQEYIESNIKENISIVKILNRFIYENKLPELNKPAIAEYIFDEIIKDKKIEEIKSSIYGAPMIKIIDMINLKNEIQDNIL